MAFKVLDQAVSRAVSRIATVEQLSEDMAETTTLPMSTGDDGTIVREEAPPVSRWRSLLIILLFMMPLVLAVWGFLEVSKALGMAGPHLPPEEDIATAVTLIQRFKWFGSLALAAIAVLTFLMIRVAFSQLDRNWERNVAERRISLESAAMRLRTQLADKTAAEEKLLKERQLLESRLAEITRERDAAVNALKTQQSSGSRTGNNPP
jgi:hypothetical protein